MDFKNPVVISHTLNFEGADKPHNMMRSSSCFIGEGRGGRGKGRQRREKEGEGRGGKGNCYNMMKNCFLVKIIDSAIYFM